MYTFSAGKDFYVSPNNIYVAYPRLRDSIIRTTIDFDIIRASVGCKMDFGIHRDITALIANNVYFNYVSATRCMEQFKLLVGTVVSDVSIPRQSMFKFVNVRVSSWVSNQLIPG
jgi:hypothetical protein